MMTYHLDEGSLQALIDGELAAGAESAARQHLESCAACTAELDEMRFGTAVVRGALERIDVPAPAAHPPARTASSRRPFGGGGTVLPRAAVVLLTVGAAGAAAAMPGSPVREWIEEVLSPSWRVAAVDAPLEGTGGAPDAPASATATAEAGVGGVELRDGRLRIVITEPTPGVQVRARLIDGSRGGAYSVAGGAHPEFRTTPGVIEIIRPAAGELRLEIPRSASAASVQVGGREYLAKQGNTLRAISPVQGEPGDEVVITIPN